MKLFNADLHIHTVLSPCGSLEMSPIRIIREAKSKGLDIIGITDHNSTRHCRLTMELGKEEGIMILPGAEVNTREEVHCLTFFEDIDKLELFQKFIDEQLPYIKNEPEIFGDQVQVDRNEKILYEEEKLLFSGIQKSIEEVAKKVKELGGLFIPAHIDRPANSIFSQLGFFPPELKADAIEISRMTVPENFIHDHPEVSGYTMIKSSDAHFLRDIGRAGIMLRMENPSFEEVKKALNAENGREVIIK